MKTAAPTLALVCLSEKLPTGDLQYPRVLTWPEPFREVVLRGESVWAVLDSGQLWTSGFDLAPVHVPLPIAVKSIACNQSVCFLISDSGRVYAWGEDAEETGVLGVRGLFASEAPMPLEDLPPSGILQVAVGTTHAAALDS